MDKQVLTAEQQVALDNARRFLKRDQEEAEEAHAKALRDAYRDFYHRLEDASIDAKTVDLTAT